MRAKAQIQHAFDELRLRIDAKERELIQIQETAGNTL